MYRRPIFLEILLKIRQEMAREADYDVDLFAEMVRGGKFSADSENYVLMEEKKSVQKPKKKARRKKVYGNSL